MKSRGGLTGCGLLLALPLLGCGGKSTSVEGTLPPGIGEAGGVILRGSSSGGNNGSASGSGSGGSSSGNASEGGPVGSSSGGISSSASGGDASTTMMGSGPANVGYYYGTGSFWVDGGAYPQLSDAASDGGAQPVVLDASPGCAPLAACCATLTGSSQALCDSIVESGDTTNCGTELSQLQADGDCTGTTVLASQVQVPPNLLVSDGTLLFWTTTQSPALLAMPVGGGAITVLLSGPITNSIEGDYPPPFLAVDDVNVYVLQNVQLIRIPKDGSAPTLVNESGVQLYAATSLGGTAYWLEAVSPTSNSFALKSAALLGGPISPLATFAWSEPDIDKMAVTSSTVFVGFASYSLFGYTLTTGASAASIPSSMAPSYVTSDTNAIYLAQSTGSNLRIGSDGTTTALGPAATTMPIVSDDLYVYWVDNTTVGTIMKAPKAGGGSATVLARDTSPTAIAVDANSIYWGDVDGYIRSMPK